MKFHIYYEPRQLRLFQRNPNLEPQFRAVVAKQNPNHVNQNIGRWTALAAITRSQEHVETLAQDIFEHFTERTRTLKGMALIVCMERLNCVRLYEALIAIPGNPEVKIIMTGNLGEDPPEWSAKGYLTTKAQREAIKERMKDAADPLQMVIVCDMWLTGTDIPCLHTLYIDKPMEGHNMIQAISRVNRVFSDKPHGPLWFLEMEEACPWRNKQGARRPASDSG